MLLPLLDAKEIKFPFAFKKMETRRLFLSFGNAKKKKLSKFFIDQKMSLTDKEKIWVIESNKKIIWVIGERIDDRFKIKDKTENVLSIELTSGKNMM